MRRKFLSVVLCVCMMLTMAPFAFAEGTDTGSTTEGAGTSTPANSSSGAGGGGSVSTSTTNAITNETDLRTALESANDEDTITISGTISIDAPLVITKTVTLTGGSITASDSFTANSDKLADMSLISLKTAGKVLTLKNITLDAKQKTLVVFSNAGKVVVDGATITGGKTNSYVAGVYMTSASQFEMNSGSITGNEVGDSYKTNSYTQYAADLWIGANANGALTSINGGTIGNIFVNSNAWSASNPGGFTMTDGNVTNLYVEYDAGYGASFTYRGGTIENLYISTTEGNGNHKTVTPVIGMTYTGGQTNDDALAPVARVGTTTYATLEAAIAAATNEQTVTLLKDTVEAVTIPVSKTVTLDLNGHKIVDSSTAQDDNVNASLRKHTITNNGVLTIMDSIGTGVVDNVSHERAALYNTGTITEIKGGKFTSSADKSTNSSSANGNSWYVVYNAKDATITKISAGDFLAIGKFSSLFSNCGTIGEISGGTFTQDGFIAFKNEGTVNKISGGTFSSEEESCIQNWGTIGEICGGAITAGRIGIWNFSSDKYTSAGKVTNISGGEIKGTTAAIRLNDYDATYLNPAKPSSTYIASATISGGKINGALQVNTNTSLTITGGYFTSDPTPYCAENLTGVASDLSGYAYMVGNATTNNDKASTDSTTVKANVATNIPQGKEELVKNAAGQMTDGAAVDGKNLEAVVKSDADKNNITKTAAVDNTAVTTYNNSKTDDADKLTAENVAIVYQSYIDVTVSDVEKTENTYSQLTVALTPMYRVVATKQDNVTNDTTLVTEGTGQNAVVIQAGQQLNNVPVKNYEVKLALPTNFAQNGNKLSIKHTKDNGSVEYYTGTVSTEGEDASAKTYVTFTTNGFSPFTIYAASANVASIGDGENEQVFTSFQAAVDAVENNGTIKALQDITSTVSGNKTFTVNANGKNVSLTAASGYNLTNDGNGKYTVSHQSSSSPGSSGGSISTPTTYAVNVNAATNGAVAADKKTASKGTTVTVTASPSKGYVVDAVKVVDKDGKDVAVTEKDGKYVFTMPASAVTVTGSFKAETPAPVALPFTDVKSGNWFYDAVKYAYAQGLMTGTSATTFAPNGTMNRAMIVTVLYRLEKSPAVTGASKFTDVPAGQWYSDAVAWAAANKIVNGYDETTFGPMNAVTREQMAAILFRYEQVKGLENVTLEENLNRFPDQNKISAYAIPALQWAVGQKIINGNADGTLDPTGTATRAQVAQIFTNLLNK